MKTGANNNKNTLLPSAGGAPGWRRAGAAGQVAVNARGASSARSEFQSAWQRERAAILRRTCAAIARAIAKGKTERKAIALAAKRASGRIYRDGRPVRLTRSTILRIFLAWRVQGEKAFALKFHPRKFTLTAAHQKAYVHLASRSDVTQLRPVLHQMAIACGVTTRTIYRAIPRRLRRAALQLHRLRLATLGAERHLQNLVAKS